MLYPSNLEEKLGFDKLKNILEENVRVTWVKVL